ncbi:MAG TPA: substrate-binding domain-containing protein [Thermoplasmata archaeon]|nr:substrate-binding domain-containing protein [Thermoplasmata archaeon]
MAAAIGIAVVLLIVGIAVGYVIYPSINPKSTSSSGTISLTETGSSLLYPLFNSYWFPNYTALAGPTVVLSAASSGSGAGQSGAETGTVNIGASDAYVTNASATSIINFPVAISSQLIYYNLPSLAGMHLNLNGTVVAMIYEGNITTWNNPMILAAQNSTVQGKLNALSSQTIYPTKRTDSSGDTFLFTSYCYMSWSGFSYPVSTSGLSGDNIANMQTGTGNSGIVSTLSKTANSIGYVGIAYEASANAAGLGYAAMGDNESLSASGGTTASNYILPTTSTISQDANLGLLRLNYPTYGLAVSLILGGSWQGAVTLAHGGGGSNPTSTSPTPYPIVNLEYALFKTAAISGSKVVTGQNLAATVAFMHWALSYGNYGTTGSASTWINAVGFVPLTQEVVGYDMTTLASVST